MRITYRLFLVMACALLAWQSSAGAATIKITGGTTDALGRGMLHETPTANVTLTKTGGGSVTYTTIVSNNGISAPGGTFSSSTSTAHISLVNNANGSGTTGAKTWTAKYSPLTPGGSGTETVSATILAQRSVTSSGVNFGNLLLNASVSATGSLSTTGDDNNFTEVNVDALTTLPDANGIKVTSGSGTLFNSATSTGARIIGGQFTNYGSITGNIALPVTTAEVASVHDTVPYASVSLHYTANVGNAIADMSNSPLHFGPALSALVHPNGSYAGLASRVVGTTGSGGLPALHSTATLLAGKNTSGHNQTIQMAWRTRTTAEAPVMDANNLQYYKPISDIVKLSGMSSHDHGGSMMDMHQDDGNSTFVLQMSYSTALLHFPEATLAGLGKIYLASLRTDDDHVNGTWENAVTGNFGGPESTGHPLLESYNAYFAGNVGSHGSKAHNSFVLGDWGVDTTTHNVWAAINYNGQFAAVPEPSSIMLAGIGFVLLTGIAARKRRRHSVGA